MLRAVIIGLKLCAIAVVVQAWLMHYANRVVTVLLTSVPKGVTVALHRPTLTSYTYVSDVRPLSFAEIKWALVVGVAIYAEALLIQASAARKAKSRQPARSQQSA